MKKLADLKQGGYFFYGGVQWVVLENDDKIGATLAIAAEPVFNRAFDEENRNDWRVSSLRRELNGPFFDALIAEGANRAAFLDWESDLTADNGMTDYGTATDKIALLSDGLYRKYRQFIPLVDDWCWTLTPWTCNPEYTAYVRFINSSGVLNNNYAYIGIRGARPLCYLESSIFVSVPGEEDSAGEERKKTIQEAAEAVMDTLGEYSAAYWVEVLARVMYGVFMARLNAEEVKAEEAATRALNNTPGDQDGNNNAAAEG